MRRTSLLLAALALSAGMIGCTHCDTCDDFPTPCRGANCGMHGPVAPMGAYTVPPTYDGPAPPEGTAPPAGPTSPDPTPDTTPDTTPVPASPTPDVSTAPDPDTPVSSDPAVTDPPPPPPSESSSPPPPMNPGDPSAPAPE